MNTAGTWSYESAPVTMLCANVPDGPAAPTLQLSALDLILLDWEPPLFDGGSPILGYSVWIQAAGDADYLLAYNGTQNPATTSLAIREYNGQPLEIRSYSILVRAYNWVGVSPDTAVALTLIVAAPSSAAYSTVEGEIFMVDVDGAHTGLAASAAAVPAVVTL